MLTIGHRGLKDEYPENTVVAVREAARAVDVVEIDIRPCGSGEFVAAHDDDLERINGGEGRISESDLDSLRTETVQNSTATIPTFEELLETWPRETGLNVDLKGEISVESVLTKLTTADVDGPVIISVDSTRLNTFDPKSIDETVGLSFLRNHIENVERAAEQGCEYVHVYYGLCLETDVVDRAHKAGLAVDAWSIDDCETTSRLEAMGVDAVTVNSRDAIV